MRGDRRPAGPAFGRGAAFYDLLYRDKDYAGEADFLWGILRAVGRPPEEVLELGSGCGRHALELAGRGCRVTGVDASPGMLAAARANAARASRGAGRRLEFVRGDFRRVRLGRTFDAVVSLFHPFSYLLKRADLEAALVTARTHLRPGGVLVFDCWHAQAVRAAGATPRRVEARGPGVRVVRTSRPILDARRGIVEVLQHFCVRRAGGRSESFLERHRLRAWSREEVAAGQRAAGLQPVDSFEWATRRPLGPRTWSACHLAARPGLCQPAASRTAVRP